MHISIHFFSSRSSSFFLFHAPVPPTCLSLTPRPFPSSPLLLPSVCCSASPAVTLPSLSLASFRYLFFFPPSPAAFPPLISFIVCMFYFTQVVKQLTSFHPSAYLCCWFFSFCMCSSSLRWRPPLLSSPVSGCTVLFQRRKCPWCDREREMG